MISIIVPVFNSEQYLPQCIESILRQRYTDFELILVDDGSNDGSPEICEHYAGIDNRIKVIHQVNSGVSCARNAGIDHASGEYIVFCDSDDYVDADYLQDMIGNLHADEDILIVSDLVRTENNGSVGKETRISERTVFLDCMQKDDFVYFFLEYRLWGPTCKLYSSSIIKNRQIRFDKDLKTAEDLDFNFSYLQCISAFHYIPSACYHYRVGCKEYKCEFISRSMIDSLHTISSALVHISKRGGVYDALRDEIALLTANKFYFSRLPAVFVSDSNISLKERRKKYTALCNQNVMFTNLCKIGRKHLAMNQVMRSVSHLNSFYLWLVYYKLSAMINRTRQQKHKE